MTCTPHGASHLNSPQARSELPGGDNHPPGDITGRRRGRGPLPSEQQKKPDVHSHRSHDLLGLLSRPQRRRTTCWEASAPFLSTEGWPSVERGPCVGDSRCPRSTGVAQLQDPAWIGLCGVSRKREGGAHQLYSSTALSLPCWLNLY